MESGQMNKNLKLEIPSEIDENMSSFGLTKFHVSPTNGGGVPVLTRQPSATKNSCLCSPTSHAGSFRCRLHRAASLQRTKSTDAAPLPDSSIKATATVDAAASSNADTVEAR